MAKQTLDLKALLESRLGDIRPAEDDIKAIEQASRSIPENLMYSAESGKFKPVTKPVAASGAKPLTVEQAKEFNANMDRFINEVLVSGVDYGVIPNCKKPSLLKSGAEKIAIFLGLIFRTEVVSRTEDFQQGFFAYETKCYAIDADGVVRGEGIATANTKEGKYIKSSGFSQQNVVLKMCKKRALVDCVLNIGGLSSRFTQDVEDMDIGQSQSGKDPDGLKAPQPKGGRPATQKQIKYLETLMQQHNNSVDAMNRYCSQAYGIADYTKVSAVQISELIAKYQAFDAQ